MLELNNIYCMDNMDGLKMIESDFVDLVVTSPPYDNLRKYNGFNYDFEGVVKELFRIIKNGGIIVWIVNDATINGCETCTSFKQALYFVSIGFNLLDTMIWCKDGGGAIGSKYCYTQNFEYMFIFCKGKPKTVNLIKDKINLSFGKDRSGVGRRKQNGEFKIEKRKPNEKMSKRNNWWLYVPRKEDGSSFHPAVFPKQIIKDHIKTWSNEGDIVLDPFMGSGTTAKAAIELNRKYIGFQISKEYCELANEYLKNGV